MSTDYLLNTRHVIIFFIISVSGIVSRTISRLRVIFGNNSNCLECLTGVLNCGLGPVRTPTFPRDKRYITVPTFAWDWYQTRRIST